MQPVPVLLLEWNIGVPLQPVQLILAADERRVHALGAQDVFLLLVVACRLHLGRDAEEQGSREPGQVFEDVGCETVEDVLGRRSEFGGVGGL